MGGGRERGLCCPYRAHSWPPWQICKIVDFQLYIFSARDSDCYSRGKCSQGPMPLRTDYCLANFFFLACLLSWRMLSTSLFLCTTYWDFQWIQHRKVIYIPKVHHPTAPSATSISHLAYLKFYIKFLPEYFLLDSAGIFPTYLVTINMVSWHTEALKSPLCLLLISFTMHAGHYNKPLQLVLTWKKLLTKLGTTSLFWLSGSLG